MLRFLVAAAAALVVAPASVAAADADRVVAGLDGSELHVRHGSRGRLCVQVTTPEYPTSLDGGCEAPPRSPFRPRQAVAVTTIGAPLGLAMPGTVAAVSVQTGTEVRRYDTIAVPGFGSRFALVPGGGPEALLRFYDAAGMLLGAAVGDADGNLEGDGGQVLFRARRVSVTARPSFTLDPNPLALDRTVPTVCTAVRVGGGGSSDCIRTDDLGAYGLSVDRACAPARPLLSGLVSSDVTRVEAVLGSGRILRAKATPLPAGIGTGSFVAESVPVGEAVRSVRSFDAAGKRLGVRRLAAAPSGLACPRDATEAQLNSFGGFVSRNKPLTPPVAAAQAGGRSLLVADGPDPELCTGLGRPVTCFTPPVDPEDSYLERKGRVVAGVLSKDVARVDIRLDRGPRVRLATTTGPAYSGRYAGLLRFVAGALPAGRFVRGAIARDAAGHRIATAYVGSAGTQRMTRRRLPGGLTLTRTVFTDEGRTTRSRCVGPRTPRATTGVCLGRDADAGRAAIRVGCAPRRVLLLGTLPEGATGVSVTLRGGRRLPARLLRFPDSRPVWFAVPPRTAEVTGLRYAGRLREIGGVRPEAVVRKRVAPAARQCGYEDSLP